MRTILISILFAALCSTIISCGTSVADRRTPSEYAAMRAANMQSNINASFLSDTEADSINNMQNGQILTAAKTPIKVAKKRNCSAKQTYEGARGGIFHYDTAKNGNIYKHYVK